MLGSEKIRSDIKQCHRWFPCTSMKSLEQYPPVAIQSAKGSHLILTSGQKVIDAIASWWCKPLGHQHPRLKQALIHQAQRYEHVISANTCQEPLEQLAYELAQLRPKLNKVFYAGDGSCAIEIAMKMSVHSRLICGENKRTRFISLRHAYHGETLGAMGVSDVGLYRQPYDALLIEPIIINHIPYVQTLHDKLWHNCQANWPQIEKQLEPYQNTATALILEPILQGAGGMKIYSQDLLKRLRAWTQQKGIHLIADEIMTGFGRTGPMLACEHANITPDFLCLSKALTGGWLPFSAVLTNNAIYDCFYHNNKQPPFLHSHTYSGNALGASLALEILAIYREENILEQGQALGDKMYAAMQAIARQTHKLINVRHIGAMVAADLNTPTQQAQVIAHQALQQGALLRPLGNTLYWLPPLNMSEQTLEELATITQKVLTDYG
jgi:adenosylmethionine-8-amino-7-oxononanoate aminotransferase